MHNCTENVLVAHSLEYPVILKDKVFVHLRYIRTSPFTFTVSTCIWPSHHMFDTPKLIHKQLIDKGFCFSTIYYIMFKKTKQTMRPQF